MIENIFQTSAIFALMSVFLMRFFSYDELPHWIAGLVVCVCCLSLVVCFLTLLILIWT